jgi:hypothetical protein
VDENERLKLVERALAQMLKPIRNIPFSIIVQSLAERQVIPIDKSDGNDVELLNRLQETIHLCAADLTSHPIRRPRPNEVGNDVEQYVMRALPKAGLTAARPTSKAGLGKSTGYPDILIRDMQNRDTYLECKIFSDGAAETTMRSFYLSPSESFKVCLDARHLLLAARGGSPAAFGRRCIPVGGVAPPSNTGRILGRRALPPGRLAALGATPDFHHGLLAFGMRASAIPGSRDSLYTPKSYKLIDLHDLRIPRIVITPSIPS